jgi:hypothetical protein
MRCRRCGESPWLHRLETRPIPGLRCPYPACDLGEWDPELGWLGRLAPAGETYPLATFGPEVAARIIEDLEGAPLERLREALEPELDLRTA